MAESPCEADTARGCPLLYVEMVQIVRGSGQGTVFLFSVIVTEIRGGYSGVFRSGFHRPDRLDRFVPEVYQNSIYNFYPHTGVLRSRAVSTRGSNHSWARGADERG